MYKRRSIEEILAELSLKQREEPEPKLKPRERKTSETNSSQPEPIPEILVKVLADDGSVMKFMIEKDNQPLRRLKTAYCDRTAELYNAVTFYYKGNIIKDTDSILSLAMEEDDIINAFPRQKE